MRALFHQNKKRLLLVHLWKTSSVGFSRRWEIGVVKCEESEDTTLAKLKIDSTCENRRIQKITMYATHRKIHVQIRILSVLGKIPSITLEK